MSTSTRATP